MFFFVFLIWGQASAPAACFSSQTSLTFNKANGEAPSGGLRVWANQMKAEERRRVSLLNEVIWPHCWRPDSWQNLSCISSLRFTAAYSRPSAAALWCSPDLSSALQMRWYGAAAWEERTSLSSCLQTKPPRSERKRKQEVNTGPIHLGGFQRVFRSGVLSFISSAFGSSVWI